MTTASIDCKFKFAICSRALHFVYFGHSMLCSSLHWLDLGFLNAFFAQWSLYSIVWKREIWARIKSMETTYACPAAYIFKFLISPIDGSLNSYQLFKKFLNSFVGQLPLYQVLLGPTQLSSSCIVCSHSVFFSWGRIGILVDGQAGPCMSWCMGGVLVVFYCCYQSTNPALWPSLNFQPLSPVTCLKPFGF